MNTTLKLLALVTAVSLPGSVAAAVTGFPLPAGFDALTAFCAFAATLVLATFAADYGRRPRTLAVSVTAPAAAKAAHPLAA